jgi:hypothetical protein
MADWRNGGIGKAIDSGGTAEWRNGQNGYLSTSFMTTTTPFNHL